MKARYDRSFERGREWVKYLMIGAITCAVMALFFTQTGSLGQVVLMVMAGVMLAATVATSLILCRCPYCGKRIVFGVMAAKSCPACNRDLNTGKRVKKSKR